MPILRHKELVEFDPLNRDHTNAIKETLETGRLSPRFRFHNEEPYTSSTSQAVYLMALEWMSHMAATKETLKIEETSSSHYDGTTNPAMALSGQRGKGNRHLYQIP